MDRQRTSLGAATGVGAVATTPLVSIIIPPRDHAALPVRCSDPVCNRTDCPEIALLIVDNDSRRRRATRRFDQLATDQRVRVPRHSGAVNWSAMNNEAARQARGEILVPLNNEVEALHPDWLRGMVAVALRPEIGAAGARLLYRDGTGQHAGMTLTKGAIATHLLRDAARDDPGYGGMRQHPRRVAAVAGACMAVRRDMFDAVGQL
jgi:GT2 family glycosyltransferase